MLVRMQLSQILRRCTLALMEGNWWWKICITRKRVYLNNAYCLKKLLKQWLLCSLHAGLPIRYCGTWKIIVFFVLAFFILQSGSVLFAQLEIWKANSMEDTHLDVNNLLCDTNTQSSPSIDISDGRFYINSSYLTEYFSNWELLQKKMLNALRKNMLVKWK